GQTSAQATGLGPDQPVQRRLKAYRLRQQAALAQFQQPVPLHPDNSDEAHYPNKLGNFSKGLPHNDLGEVEPNAYAALIRALSSGNPADFEAIPMGCPSVNRKLVSPQAGLAFELEGGDPHSFFMPPAPAFDSAERQGEIVENYWMALLRDVPFTEFDSQQLAH